MVEVSTDKVDAEVPGAGERHDHQAAGRRRRRGQGRRRPRRARAGVERRLRAGSATAEPTRPLPEAKPRKRTGNGLRPSEEPSVADSPATTDDASVSAGETTAEGALQVVMPEMGESVTEGTVLEWRVSEGDAIAEGDTIVEVSTDKVDAEVPAPTSGTVTKLLVEVDAEVKVGRRLAEITPGEAAARTLPSAEAATDEAEAARPKRSIRRGRSHGKGDPRRSPHRRRARSRPRQRQRQRLRRQGDQGGRAGRRRRQAGSAAPAAAAGEAKPLRGPAAMLAKAMEESRADPDGDLVPHPAGGHPRRQAEGAQRRAQGARDEGVVHPPDRLGDRPGRQGVAGDGADLRGARRQAVRDRGRRRQPRDRGRRRAQGRLAQPDGPLHQGRRRARLRRLPRLLRGADHQDPREQAHRRRLPGHQHLADQPRRAGDDRLGAAADDGPGHDHRHRLDRLPARVGPRQPGPDQAARRLEGDDDDVDLRPPDHPGRRVRVLPAPHRAAAAGRGRLLRERRRQPRHRGVGGDRRPSVLRVGAAAGRRRARRRRHDQAGRAAAAGGPGGDLAAQGLPHPRAPRGPARPARLRAEGRPGDPAREPQPDARADGADPGLDPAHRRAGGDPARLAAADAGGLLRHDRLPVRAPLLPPAAHLAAGDGRDRGPPRAARQRGEAAPPAPPDRRLRVRALHREGLPGPEDVLDRGARHDRADARRAGHAGRCGRAPTRSSSAWPIAAGSASSPTTSGGRRTRSSPSSRARSRSTRSRRRRRSPTAAPATSSTTTATRGPTRPTRARRSRFTSTRTRATSSSSTRSSPAPPATRSRSSTGPRIAHDPKRAVPVLLHGDAAFPGQGVVAETLNLQALTGLHDRRHDPRHPEQPGRLHHRSRGQPLDPLRGRHGEGLQRADHPRQRRRRRGLLGGDPAGDGLPRALGARHRHRRDRLPPLRPQRDRRARLHAAADGGQDQGPPAGLRDLCGEAGLRGRGHRRGGRGGSPAAPRGDAVGAQGPAREDGGRRVRGPDGRHRHRRAGPQGQPAGRHERSRGPAAVAERGPAQGPGELHRPPQAAQSRWRSGSRRSSRAASSSATPSRSPSRRC